MNEDWNDLIQRYIAGITTEEESARLEEVLKRDDDVVRLYLRYMNLDVALEAHAGSSAAVRELLVSPDLGVTKPWRSWVAWRPLTAAAAGLAFGMFCTSMVFGFVVPRGGEKKVPVALFQPGFEDSKFPLTKDFPNTPARWGGDEAAVVTTENSVQPKEGNFMLRLEPALRGSPRVYQVLDLESLPSHSDSGMRQIEIVASFAPADAAASVRYLIRAFAVSDAPQDLDAAWFDRRDEAISSSMIGLDGLPGDPSWQTFGLRIQVPASARSLVLFFGVRTPDKSLPKAANYIDDVRVSLIESQPLP